MNADRLLIPAIDPVLTSELNHVIPGAGRLPAAAQGNGLIRLRRGLRFPDGEWAALTPTERYRAFVAGVTQTFKKRPVLSHYSAAALWGLPIIGPWPREVHILVPHASGGRSDPGIRRHAIGVPEADVVDIDGFLVTSIARTVLDLATTAPMLTAIAAADAALWVPRGRGALPLVAKSEIWQLWSTREFRGKRRAQELIQFADTGAESPLESASRVNIALAGFPQPVLQHRIEVDGREYWGDFYWPGADAWGEVDGLVKYVDPNDSDGVAAAEAVYREKLREDAVRRRVTRFARWDRGIAMSRTRLRRRLIELGLEPRNHEPRHLRWPL
ncbi:hypothetical protein [Gryllotalpicola protaetiae]|nr:hypothetical protein [Gryllotalpicola protaetiae]